MNTTKSPFSPPSLPEEKPKRRWTLPVVVLVLVLLPVLVGVAWYFNYRTSGASSVEQLKAKIKARGEPLTLADLAATYPPIPDPSNGAVALLQEWKKESPVFWQAFEDGAKLVPDRAARHYDNALPFMGSDFQQISHSTVLQSSNLIAAENYLRENKEHIETVRAALHYSQFRFPVQITNGFETLLPHLSEVKHEALNFRVAGLVASERGDVDGAISNIEDTARAGDAVAAEPFLISQLVRIACYTMAIADMERLLSQRSLSAAQLEKIEGLLNRLQMTGAARKTLVTERATDLAIFKMPASVLDRIGSQPGDDTDSSSSRGASIAQGILELTGLRDMDKRLMLETFEQAIPLVDRDDPEAIEQYEVLFREVQAEARKFPPKILTAMLLPGLGEAMHRFAQLEARRRAALSAIAVERFRLAHDGHLPAKLDELKPQFLTDVPKDPFDGQPLRFKQQSPGYVIYSVGADRVDNDGLDRAKRYPRKDYDETFTVER
jgi:hypothetical protein